MTSLDKKLFSQELLSWGKRQTFNFSWERCPQWLNDLLADLTSSRSQHSLTLWPWGPRCQSIVLLRIHPSHSTHNWRIPCHRGRGELVSERSTRWQDGISDPRVSWAQNIIYLPQVWELGELFVPRNTPKRQQIQGQDIDTKVASRGRHCSKMHVSVPVTQSRIPWLEFCADPQISFSNFRKVLYSSLNLSLLTC